MSFSHLQSGIAIVESRTSTIVFLEISLSPMMYVKPLSLFEECLEISKKKVPRGWKWGQLLGLDLNDKCVSLSVSNRQNLTTVTIDPLFREKETIDPIAIKIRSLISRYKLHFVIVGYPCGIKNENPSGEQVKIFINDLHNTGKLESLKYTFWDKRFASKEWEIRFKRTYRSVDYCNNLLVRPSGDNVLKGYLHCFNGVKLDGGSQ